MRAVIIRESGTLPSMAQLLLGHSFRQILCCNCYLTAKQRGIQSLNFSRHAKRYGGNTGLKISCK